jgi:hypothetical protein
MLIRRVALSVARLALILQRFGKDSKRQLLHVLLGCGYMHVVSL